MDKEFSFKRTLAFCAVFLSFLASGGVASFATAEEFDLAQWQESSERKAGTRMTIKVGNSEYGFVWIPAGEFVMGSPTTERWRNYDEEQIRVKLTRGFWMLETEVTQKLYKDVMGTNPTWKGHAQGNFLPVDYVSYDDAVKFAEELTKRLPKGLTAQLPTEAQWEYACRAGTTTAFWYGNDEDPSKMNVGRGGAPKTVKSYAPNPWGLYDMHGNVSEWTRGWYVQSYSGEYGNGTAVDPEGGEEPDESSRRVFRGGGYGSARPLGGATHGRSAGRGTNRTGPLIDTGLRVILICD